MDCYKLRITTPDEQKVVKFLTKYADTGVYAYVYEVGKAGERPHFHIYFETTHKNMTIRAYIRANVGKGNSAYSLEKCDEKPVQLLGYMLKECPGTPCYSGLTDEFLQLAREYDDNMKADYQARKKTRLVTWKHILSLSRENGYDKKDYYEAQGFIGKLVLAYYIENEMLIRRFQLVSIVDTVMLHLFPDNHGNFLMDILK